MPHNLEQQIVDALKERFPAPWFTDWVVKGVDDDQPPHYWAIIHIANSGISWVADDPILKWLLDKVLAIPLPAPPVQWADFRTIPEIERDLWTGADRHKVQQHAAGEDDLEWLRKLCVPDGGVITHTEVCERVDRIANTLRTMQARLDAADKLEWQLVRIRGLLFDCDYDGIALSRAGCMTLLSNIDESLAAYRDRGAKE